MHIMMVPSWYSSPSNPVHGSFFKEQFIAVQKSGAKVSVAYNEIFPLTKFGQIKGGKGITFNVEDGLRTYRYRDYNYFPKNPKMFKSFNKRMEKLYLEIVKKEGKVDVIHAHSALWAGISAAFVASKYNIPFVLTEHSSLKLGNVIRDSYLPSIINSYNSSDILIAVGSGLKKEIQELTNNKVEVIPNLVKFTDKAIINSQNNEKIRLFSLAYLVPGKGMEMLISAFTKVFKNKEVELVIGGDGILRKELEYQVNTLEMTNQITFKGLLSRNEVYEEMCKCNGFVLASNYETFGVVYIEALSVGKPILGTKNGGAEDIINEKNGVIVDNENEIALQNGLVKFIETLKDFNSDLIKANCISKYSEEIIVNKLKEIYDKVIRER